MVSCAVFPLLRRDRLEQQFNMACSSDKRLFNLVGGRTAQLIKSEILLKIDNFVINKWMGICVVYPRTIVQIFVHKA
jgi:hypothetical protein